MSKGKLGNLQLTDAWGPLQTLINKLASDEGEEYLVELRKFNRKEPSWVPETRANEFLGPYEIPDNTPADLGELIRLSRSSEYARYSVDSAFSDVVGPYAKTLWIYAPNRSVREPEVRVALMQNGMNAATYLDLLAFVATQKLPAKTGRIIALGSAEEFAGKLVSPLIQFVQKNRGNVNIRKTIYHENLIIGRPYFLARKVV